MYSSTDNGCDSCSTVPSIYPQNPPQDQLMGNMLSAGLNAPQNPYLYTQPQAQPVQQAPSQAPPQPAQPAPKPQVQQIVVQNSSNKNFKGVVQSYMLSASGFKMTVSMLLALALHETIKNYITQSIKFNDGSPTYFVVYAVVVAVVAVCLSTF